MKIDLLHNKIIKDTVTPNFVLNFNENLIPKLIEKHGDALSEVRMYEDCLSYGFTYSGEFYYPLTVTVSGEAQTEWIKWNVSAKKLFENQVPYAYNGAMPLEFSLADDVPPEFPEKISLDTMHICESSAPLVIQSASPDKTFLSGKYSQSFVDLMAAEISKRIENLFSVSGIRESGVELMLVFAPGTYMEHIAGNVTYRRLLITARACSARDLWIKWTNLKGNDPLSVSMNVRADDVLFELAEDVPQKIREKEYRFLVRTSADKYQFAMGRKNITEWRDLIKRVIKRGELTLIERSEDEEIKISAPIIEPAPIVEEVEFTPAIVVPEEPEISAPEASESDDVASKLSEMLSSYAAKQEAPEIQADANDNSDLSALLKNVLGVAEEQEPDEEEIADGDVPFDLEEIVEEPAEDLDEGDEEPVEQIPVIAEEPKIDRAAYEDELRRTIEAEIRAKLEAEARAKLEAEAEELRRAKEALEAENERLAEIARKQEAEKADEAERLRRELEAKERAEARERERLQEAARAALIEQQRLAEERRAEEARLLAEKARAEEEERRLEEQRKAELLAREAEAKAQAEERAKQPNYISKNARLLFRRPVDPNVTKRIHEIILTTIKYYHKENVFIKIKATVPDSTTVNLNFVKIPENETELLINIIKVLGKSELGIVKVYLE